MPIYEYLCRECNRIFSFLSPSMSEERIPECPKCGAATEKQVSIFAFLRGGTDPLAAIPPGDEEPDEDADRPVRDDGLYRFP